MERELLKRYSGNPILTYKDLPFHINAIYNPGAVKFGDKYVMIPRVEDGRRDNSLHVAMSSDGIHFTVNPEPIYIPGTDEELVWEKHRYDPRVTFLEGSYYITYCAQTMEETVRIGMTRTQDFKTFERLPFQTLPWSRNCTLFPEKIRGKYARIERPMNGGDAINFVSYSEDLVHWGESKPINLELQTWMRAKWGPGPTPIKTDKGWLLIIHGVWFATNVVYRLGVVLLDLENPNQIIGQCPEFILTPRECYERCGEVPNVVFCNGAIPEPNGDLKVYYGAADTCIGLATCQIDELIQACLEGIHPPRIISY